jgi:DNA-directed RNA polymerase specialized sigma24 family protein
MLIFEDCIEEIDELLEKSRSKWHLDAVQWLGYDDVSQIIRIHVYNKWHLWNQERPFKPWCRSVISNQISNLIRNNYSSFSKPCLKCPHYMSENMCAFTNSKIQDESCPLYAKWLKKKRDIHDIRLPLPLDGKTPQDCVGLYDDFDFEKSAETLHDKVKKKLLNDKHREIYHQLYVEELEDAEIIKRAGFKREAGKSDFRCKQLEVLKRKFQSLAREIVYEEDIIS